MRNIFLFIRRYFNFLFFLVLQILALSFLFHYNKFHEAAFMHVANEMTGGLSARYDNIEYYFRLKKTNDDLVRQNETLLNQLKEDYEIADTNATVLPDTLALDTPAAARKYLWRSAKVVRNSVNLQNNYLTIHRGYNQGIRKDMGVISAGGVVGTVVDVSSNFAIVMSMLHRQSRISAKLKKTGEVGVVQWDGEDPHFVTMSNIPKSVPVAKGDSVVTSQYSYHYPSGIMVGTIAAITADPASNFYTLKLKTATNFFNVEFVYVVENLQKDEQKQLEEATLKNQ